MSNIIMHDFTNMAAAKSFVLALMDSGAQFSFCAHPISVSHVSVTAQKQEAPVVQELPLEGA